MKGCDVKQKQNYEYKVFKIEIQTVQGFKQRA
jgi:hypothetical protein